MSDVTRILSLMESGDASAAGRLLPLVYEELRKLATARLAREKPGQTLQATALVHEAYVRLVDQETPQTWQNRGHFFAAAARAMQRILVEQARRKQTQKCGGASARLSLDDISTVAAPAGRPTIDLIALDEALQLLEREQPVKAQLVKLRYFAGVPLEDAAQMLGISPATAKRYWVHAQAWLYGKLQGD